MFGGLFDPPHVKAEKQAAKSLGTLRQKAATNLEIELRILFNALSRAELNGNKSLQSGGKWNVPLGTALYEAQEFISNIENAFPDIMNRLSRLTQASLATNQYADLIKFESELKDLFDNLTKESSNHLRIIRSTEGKIIDQGPSVEKISIQEERKVPSVEDRIKNLDAALSSFGK